MNAHILPTDFVVFIVGPPGSGKSRVLDNLLQIAKTHVPLDKYRKSHTMEVYAERCCFQVDEMIEINFVLVDTPPFYTNKEPNGEEILKKWMDSKFITPCEAVVILYTHDIASNPDDPNLKVSKHLEAFRRTCSRDLTPSIIHIVPTMFSWAMLSAQRVKSSTTRLQHQADGVGASMLRTPFGGRPDTVWDTMQEISNNLAHSFVGRSKQSHWPVPGTTLLEQKKKAAADRIILKRRPALESAPVEHTDRRSASINIANELSKRYESERTKADLDEIISLRRTVLELTPPLHWEHLICTISLVNFLEQRYRREFILKDLTGIITLRRAVLNFTSPEHPERPSSLVNLANYLDERYQREGCTGDLDEVITYRRAALELTPRGHPEHLEFLFHLIKFLDKRYSREGDMKDLAEIITRGHAALTPISPRCPGHRMPLVYLANCLDQRYQLEGAIADLTGVITHRRAALDLTPPGHPEYRMLLTGLVRNLDERLRRNGTMGDLTETITLRRAALNLTPLGHSEHYTFLTGLARNLDERLKREGAMEDLTETIALKRAALNLTSPGHPERHILLTGLARNLDERLRREGAMEDLTETIALKRAALNLTSPGHPERHILLTGLARNLDERLRREGAMEDLTETITLRRAILKFTPSVECLAALVNELANKLDKRFRKESATDYSTKPITHQRAALELNPSGHPELLVPLANLANYLDKRLDGEGLFAYLDERISLRRAILECTPPASPDRSISLINLATCLRERYQRLSVAAELDEAIVYARDAMVLCPPENHRLTRKCLADCIGLKIKSRDPPVAVVISNTEQMISKIVDETVTTLPLRLLDTETGGLCDRDAQLLRFERSAPYKELLSSAAIWDSQQLEMQARKVISKFFRYTMLSHRWGRGEPLLCDMKGTSAYDLHSTGGVAKLQMFCVLALRQGFLWGWSDTCCIDKSSSAELQEAIGSMFSWYRQSALTIVYLSDVSNTMSFTKSVWFKRGWTLQELLASETVFFYMRDWSPYAKNASLNHKTDDAVLEGLQNATGIGEKHLRNFRPGMDDARLRLKWASTRLTTKPEDIAYSLFGVLDLHLPVLYGESAEKALGRLLADIVSQSGDASVLDWVGKRSTFHSCFPATLQPYQTVPCEQSVPSNPTGPSNVDTKRVLKLHKAIVKLPRPRFINRRLSLPSFVYPVTRFKLLRTWGSSSRHEYEIHASGLTPLQVTLSVSLQEGSDSIYTLVRPWHPKWIAPGAKDTEEAVRMLLERFGQPFHTLLLKALPHNEYERISSDYKIAACAKDLASIISSNLQVLEIV